MHEMGIACSVIEAVQKEMERYPRKRVVKVGLRIGALAGVDAESLRFCFEAITKGSSPARRGLPLELDIELCASDELEMAHLELEDEEEAA
jgi:hydrogenase nickel incorporation protein HypA/HybF